MCEALVSAMSGVCVDMYITCGSGTQRCPLKSQVRDQSKNLCFFIAPRLIFIDSATEAPIFCGCFRAWEGSVNPWSNSVAWLTPDPDALHFSHPILLLHCTFFVLFSLRCVSGLGRGV